MHHQGAGGQYFRCHTSWTSRIRLLGSAEQSKLQLHARKLDTLQTIILITLVEHNNTRGRTTIPILKMEKNITWHYAGSFHTSLHFTSGSWHEVHLQFWLLANTTRKWKCPARLDWFELEPTTSFIFLLSLVCALVLKWIWWQQYNILIIIYEK